MRKRLIAFIVAMTMSFAAFAPLIDMYAMGEVATSSELPDVFDHSGVLQNDAETDSPTEKTEQATVEPDATLIFGVTPEVTATPESSEEPSSTPVVTPEATVTPDSSEEPSSTPVVTPEATVTPEPSEEPSSTPEVTPEAAATPEPTEEPFPTPEVTPEVYTTPEPTEEVMPTPAVTSEATVAPEATVTPEIPPENKEPVVLNPLNVLMYADAGFAVANQDTVHFTVSYADGIPPYHVSFSIQSETGIIEYSEATYTEPGMISFSWMPAAYGFYTIQASVVDGQGQAEEASVSVSVSSQETESRYSWEKSVADVQLTGEWDEDLVAVAQTQVGYSEKKQNFIFDDAGNRKNYTRYGDWYGSPYGDWCAMFVAFCLHYADIPKSSFPFHANCGEWVNKLKDMDVFMRPENEYVPMCGDLVFFKADDEGIADHMGIVEDADGYKLYTIEGNVNNSVCRKEYELSDATIIGYASMEAVMRRAGKLTEEAADVQDNGNAVTLKTKTNMRSDADINSQRIACIEDAGTRVTVISMTQTNNTTWYYVEYEGKMGFIRGDLLQVEEEIAEYVADEQLVVEENQESLGYTVKDDVNVREGMSTKTSRIMRLETAGTMVTVLHTDVNDGTVWYFVSYGNKEGYIRGDLLQLVTAPTAAETVEPSVEQTESPAPVDATTTDVPGEYLCGFDEHTHNEFCMNAEGVLACELSEHMHGEDCLAPVDATTTDVPGEYLCGFDEHTHNEFCMNAEGVLACELSEHMHGEDCLVPVDATTTDVPVEYLCGLDEHTHNEFCMNAEGALACELSEHMHGEDCLVPVDATTTDVPVEYLCGLDEHTHNEFCMNAEGALACELSEHMHGEDCLVPVDATTTDVPGEYLCGLDEHTHNEICMNAEGVLACELSEHMHGEDCLVPVDATTTDVPVEYLCGLDEHTHNEFCMNAEGVLACELSEHMHGEDCLVPVDATTTDVPVEYLCGLDEHTHNEFCMNAEGVLACELSEHMHGEDCLVSAETVVPQEILDWISENNPTEEMIERAMKASSLDAVVVEDDFLVYVRTGEIVAMRNPTTGAYIDIKYGIAVYPTITSGSEDEVEEDDYTLSATPADMATVADLAAE